MNLSMNSQSSSSSGPIRIFFVQKRWIRNEHLENPEKSLVSSVDGSFDRDFFWRTSSMTAFPCLNSAEASRVMWTCTLDAFASFFFIQSEFYNGRRLHSALGDLRPIPSAKGGSSRAKPLKNHYFFGFRLDIRSLPAIVSISIYTYHLKQNNPVPRGQGKIWDDKNGKESIFYDSKESYS